MLSVGWISEAALNTRAVRLGCITCSFQGVEGGDEIGRTEGVGAAVEVPLVPMSDRSRSIGLVDFAWPLP